MIFLMTIDRRWKPILAAYINTFHVGLDKNVQYLQGSSSATSKVQWEVAAVVCNPYTFRIGLNSCFYKWKVAFLLAYQMNW